VSLLALFTFLFVVFHLPSPLRFTNPAHSHSHSSPQGCIRRGVTVEGLKGFILSQGASRRIITMEWDKFWAENKTVLETAAHRLVGQH